MKNTLYISLLFCFSVVCVQFCAKKQEDDYLVYTSKNLEITRLTEKLYQCVSYLDLPGSKVACNGVLYVSDDDVYVFDTPSKNTVSAELITFVREEWKKEIKGIIVNHFHEDAMGGLEEFHTQGIPSYASNRTIEKAIELNKTVPETGFEDSLLLEDGFIKNYYFGEAHAPDNIMSVFPAERAAFGGCMIKSLGANEGNLSDANVKAWPETVRKIKKMLPHDYLIVPGHGATGNGDLLDYTIGLFETK